MTRYARAGKEQSKKAHQASTWDELRSKSTPDKNGKSAQGSNGDHFLDSGRQAASNLGNSLSKAKRRKLKGSKNREPSAAAKYRQAYLKRDQTREQRRLRRKESRRAAMVCFNCRKPGHRVGECPGVAMDTDQSMGICFKCGSTEHKASECSVKVPQGEYPYAKCFICGEMGHITKQCPDNPRGLYPKGGCCKECGSVEHFKRDCPDLRKQQGIEDNRLSRVTSRQSADAECDTTRQGDHNRKQQPDTSSNRTSGDDNSTATDNKQQQMRVKHRPKKKKVVNF